MHTITVRPRATVRGGDAVGMLDQLLAHACQQEISDIHIQPERDGVLVRWRCDGILQDYQFMSLGEGHAVLARLKVLTGGDVMQAMQPQDGGFRINVADRMYDIRLSVFPSLYGEKAVLRLLCADAQAQQLSELGLPDTITTALQTMSEQSQGFFVVTGPTGSGKTTTLYALLQAIDRVKRNVVTLEDPIEYRIDRVTQTQVQAGASFSFADAVRSLLRQDPDVALIGEMRDKQTAQSAIEAALTGHLVLSSLHTTHASAAPIRLREMGVEPYLIASSLTGVLAQRLVPRLCDACKYCTAGSEVHQSFGRRFERYITSHWNADGCTECSFQGRKGRVVLAELFVPDELAREAMRDERTTTLDMYEHAQRCGVTPLGEHGLSLAEQGIICLDDLMRLGV